MRLKKQSPLKMNYTVLLQNIDSDFNLAIWQIAFEPSNQIWQHLYQEL